MLNSNFLVNSHLETKNIIKRILFQKIRPLGERKNFIFFGKGYNMEGSGTFFFFFFFFFKYINFPLPLILKLCLKHDGKTA